MESFINNDKSTRSEIIQDLENLGCCDICILRYLGVTEPHTYRGEGNAIRKIIHPEQNENGSTQTGTREDDNENIDSSKDGNGQGQPAPKMLKKTPCFVCLGLLDEFCGASEDILDQIAKAVLESDIQTKSYTVNLSLPVAIQFRTYFVWYYLLEKYPHVYSLFPNMKPECINLKNTWKWICTGRLKDKVDPESDWVSEGCLIVTVTLNYEDDKIDCFPLSKYFRGTKSNHLSRGSIDVLLKDLSVSEFKTKVVNSPPNASKWLSVEGISCSHVPLFLAGRYNKYSRNVSQTPWIIDGKRYHDGSVEELIAAEALPLFKAESEKFSASGREDVDVRMLGRGRPFILELTNPKRTLFTQEDINNLRNHINQSTKLIQVNDLQLVDRKSSIKLKEGEELKRKNYCALCRIPNGEVTDDLIEKLNNTPLPLVLQQKTPVRVLHRRSLMTRERSVYAVRAVPCKSKDLFKLHVQTQAGTYVKELVHGDLGRTKPSIAEILDCDADIVSLDVEDIDFPWPPQIDD